METIPTKTLNMRLGNPLTFLRLWWLAKRGWVVLKVEQTAPKTDWRAATIYLERSRPGPWWVWL